MMNLFSMMEQNVLGADHIWLIGRTELAAIAIAMDLQMRDRGCIGRDMQLPHFPRR